MMKFLAPFADVRPLPGEVAAVRARIAGAARWTDAARAVREASGRLVALWGADHRRQDGAFSVFAAYAIAEGLCVAELAMHAEVPAYPDLSGLFPAAGRMQRAVRDLLGIEAQDASDARPWLRHGAWREDEFPLRHDFMPREPAAEAEYAFVRVEGDGVHEIPVGPIHAGIIEPGHFRFSVVGEKVLRLEERLGYTHKGIDRRFADFSVADGFRLAGASRATRRWRMPGPTRRRPRRPRHRAPARARWLRALLLERERIANHLGDLGASATTAASPSRSRSSCA
jgi:Ni,Fe-hydrogenase III component G